MKKIFFYLFLFCCHYSYADNKEDIQKAKKRILLVVLEDGAEKEVTEFNDRLKNITSKSWKFNDSILYKTRSEVSIIDKSACDKYFILELRYLSFYSNHLFTPFEKTTIKRDFESTNWIYLYLGEKKLSTLSTVNHKVLLAQSYCNYRDPVSLVLKIKSIQLYLYEILNGANSTNDRYASVDKNHSLLFNKVLLVDTALLFDKSDTSKISEYYKYPFKISNGKEIGNAILNADARFAFIEILNSSQPTSNGSASFVLHYIYDTENCTLLSTSPRGSLGWKFDTDGKIHLKNFKAYEVQ